MKRNTKQTFIKIAHLCEILLSIVILLVILLGIFDILREVYGAYIIDFANPVNYEQLNNFLAQILLLVIAVELVIMLCLHRPETLLEVLLYAIARKLLLLPKTAGMADLLLGIISIAGLFAIRKYLLTDDNSTMNVTSIHYEDCEEGEDCKDCESCRERYAEQKNNESKSKESLDLENI